MKKPMRPGAASPGYMSSGYGSPPTGSKGGPGGGKRGGNPGQRDAHSSGDFGSVRAERPRRGPGGGGKRRAGGGFGDDYADDMHGGPQNGHDYDDY